MKPAQHQLDLTPHIHAIRKPCRLVAQRVPLSHGSKVGEGLDRDDDLGGVKGEGWVR